MHKLILFVRAFPKITKFLLVLALVVIAFFGYIRLSSSKSAKPTYTTSVISRGNLVVTVSGSGSVTATNNVTVGTQATGVVTKVYVKDGDIVKVGAKLADLELDASGKQSYLTSLASYQSATNNLSSAKSSLDSLNSAMWKAHETFMSDAVARNLPGDDPTHIIQSSDWLSAEAKYKTQLEAITQASTALSASYLSYQEHSPAIYAPISGKISGFSLQEGTVVNATTSTSGSSLSTKIASIVTSAKPTITITLTEVDITKVHAGDKATITIDSQPDKTFTGEVVSVDTVGSVSSGVTSYPVALRLDTDEQNLYPNMSASASIISAVKNDVLLVPASSISTENGVTSVQVMHTGIPETVTVQLGMSSDSETEIISGLSEGDEVVTSTIQNTPSSANFSSQSQSVFSSFGRTGSGTRIMAR